MTQITTRNRFNVKHYFLTLAYTPPNSLRLNDKKVSSVGYAIFEKVDSPRIPTGASTG